MFLLFVFVFGAEEVRYPPAEEQTDAAETDTMAGMLSFTAGVYEVMANQEMDMRQYLECDGVDEEDVVWSSDSEGLTVGSKGHIVANDYGLDCKLTASCRTDERVQAECVVRSGTKEEDFVFQVEALNGGYTGDEVIGMQLVIQGTDLLIVSEKGMGKRTQISEFTAQNRGGKGVKCYKITEKTGNVVGIKAVNEDDEVMIINTEGIIIRMLCSGISVLGRITSGVKLINLKEGDLVASIAKVRDKEKE